MCVVVKKKLGPLGSFSERQRFTLKLVSSVNHCNNKDEGDFYLITGPRFGIIFSSVCVYFLWLMSKKKKCVKVLLQPAEQVICLLIKASLQEVNCSTFCKVSCFYWLTHVQLWNLLKPAEPGAHTLTHTHNQSVQCSHVLYTRTETQHVSQSLHHDSNHTPTHSKPLHAHTRLISLPMPTNSYKGKYPLRSWRV